VLRMKVPRSQLERRLANVPHCLPCGPGDRLRLSSHRAPDPGTRP
jgi:hypothetical protein